MFLKKKSEHQAALDLKPTQRPRAEGGGRHCPLQAGQGVPIGHRNLLRALAARILLYLFLTHLGECQAHR